MNFLMKTLGSKKKLKRLYRASEHKFEAFHKFCDDKVDTLTLVRTEFGKIIGGYTHYPWTSSNSWSEIKNWEKQTFLISLDMKETFVPQDEDGDNLMYCHKDYGPCFGGKFFPFFQGRGTDLCLMNNGRGRS